MEEDIKIVKEIKKEFITKMKKDITHNDNPIYYRNIQALQNILNELERLQKKNEILIEKNIKYDETLEKLQKETIWKFKIQNKIEELEEDKNKLDEINKTTRLYSPYDTYDFQINILKELLGDK